MNLINEFMNPNSVLRQGQVLSHALGMKAMGTEIQKLIDPMILQRMCVASYAIQKGEKPAEDIEGWRLVGSTPTVLCYTKYGVSVVAVRGTATTDDWQTNTTIPLNQLADTKRAQTLIQEVEKWKNARPNETQWFATGHSLGGALCDVLLHEKLVREAFTFNPAVQPKDFNGKLPNRRVYARGDPLYQLMGKFTVGAVLLPAKDFLTELRYRIVGETAADYLSQHALSAFKDAPQSALVGNAKKQPKQPKKSKPRLPVPRGPNLQLIQDLFKKLEAQREPDREMDDLTREMDQIIPKDKTPAPPPPSPPSEGSGRKRKMRGGVNAEDLNRWIEIIKQTTKWKDEPNTEVARQIRLIIDSFDVILPSATKQEKRIISRIRPELERAFESWKESRYKDDERDAMMNVMDDVADFYGKLEPDAPDLAEQRWQAEIQQRRDQKRAERLKLKSIKANKEVEEEADEEIERGSPIKSPKKQFLPTESPKGNGMSGGVTNDHLEEALGYYEMKMPETYSVENLEQSMKVIQTVIKYIGRSATYDEKRRLRTYYDFINEELDAYKELNKKEKQQRFTLTVKRLNDFTNFLYSLKPPASEDPKKNLIADEIKEDAEVKRRTADYEARLQKKKEADEKLKEGKARPATFQYSREGLTANQKAAERAAYYRKNPAENPRKKVVEPVKVEYVKPKKERTPKKVKEVKEVKEEPKEEPKEPTLADRAKLTRAKTTLRKGIVRRLLRKLAEIRLWVKLYQTGPYFISTELKTKEREAYDVGRGIFTKNEWDEAYKQATDIDNRKWQNYLPQSAYDRIAKQVATIKEKVQKEADDINENGPKPDRPKRLPKQEGVKRMVTPNGYEWYVEDGKVFDLDGSRVGYKGMAAFKNIREI